MFSWHKQLHYKTYILIVRNVDFAWAWLAVQPNITFIIRLENNHFK